MNKRQISASKLANFLYCPFTFELQSAGYEPKEPYVPALAIGNAVHEAYRLIALYGMPPEDAVETAVASVSLASGHELSPPEKAGVLRRVLALPDWVFRVKDVEVEFKVPLDDDIIMTGRLDGVTEDRIIDLKSVSKHKSFANNYALQAQFYMYATRIPNLTFVMIDDNGVVVTYDIVKADDSLVEGFIRYAVESLRQPYKPPAGLTNILACSRCAFAYACPFYKLISPELNRKSDRV